MALTVNEIKHAQPGPWDYKLTDSNGLFLLIRPAGGKSWRFKYRFGTRERTITLGRFPSVWLVAAREAHQQARQPLLEGKDPATEKKRAKIERIAASQATFRRVGEEWLIDMAPTWSPSSAKRVRHRFERDLYPVFGSWPIGEIDSGTILRALRKIEARGSIETARRVRGYVRAVFKRRKDEGYVTHDVILQIDEIKDALKPAKRGARQPALVEVPALLELQQCVDRSTSNLLVKLASRLLALAIVRVGVLREAPWSEFEGIDWDRPDSVPDQPIWRVPAHRMKLEVEDKGNAAFGHDVPLSTQAVDVLRAIRVISGHTPILFPGSRSWRTPLSNAALSAMYKRRGGCQTAFKRDPRSASKRDPFSDMMLVC